MPMSRGVGYGTVGGGGLLMDAFDQAQAALSANQRRQDEQAQMIDAGVVDPRFKGTKISALDALNILGKRQAAQEPGDAEATVGDYMVTAGLMDPDDPMHAKLDVPAKSEAGLNFLGLLLGKDPTALKVAQTNAAARAAAAKTAAAAKGGPKDQKADQLFAGVIAEVNNLNDVYKEMKDKGLAEVTPKNAYANTVLHQHMGNLPMVGPAIQSTLPEGAYETMIKNENAKSKLATVLSMGNRPNVYLQKMLNNHTAPFGSGMEQVEEAKRGSLAAVRDSLQGTLSTMYLDNPTKVQEYLDKYDAVTGPMTNAGFTGAAVNATGETGLRMPGSPVTPAAGEPAAGEPAAAAAQPAQAPTDRTAEWINKALAAQQAQEAAKAAQGAQAAPGGQ